MLALLILAAQAAASAPPATAPADISLRATLDAKSVKVIDKGKATIGAHATPDGGSTAVSSGNRQSRHFEVQVDARIAGAAAAANSTQQETDSNPPR